jgi:hypothetical protein
MEDRMANPIDSEKMSPEQRLGEVTMILAAAMLRVLMRKRLERGVSRDPGGNPLGCPVETRPLVTAG